MSTRTPVVKGLRKGRETKSSESACLPHLLPELVEGHVLLVVLGHDLGDSELKVLLCHVKAPLTKRKHAGLGTNTLSKRKRMARDGAKRGPLARHQRPHWQRRQSS